ncbi:MAG: hypothetical protein ABI867_40475 [Kofleriaceae bacterium]
MTRQQVSSACEVDQRLRALEVHHRRRIRRRQLRELDLHDEDMVLVGITDRGEAEAEALCDAVVRGFLASLYERTARAGDPLPALVAHASPGPEAPDLVEHRASDPLLGERDERLLARRVEPPRGLAQSHHGGTDDVLGCDHAAVSPREGTGDVVRDLEVVEHQLLLLVEVGRRR